MKYAGVRVQTPGEIKRRKREKEKEKKKKKRDTKEAGEAARL